MSSAQFELSVASEESVENCRRVYADANRALKTNHEKEERLMLLESWREFEVGTQVYDVYSTVYLQSYTNHSCTE